MIDVERERPALSGAGPIAGFTRSWVSFTVGCAVRTANFVVTAGARGAPHGGCR